MNPDAPNSSGRRFRLVGLGALAVAVAVAGITFGVVQLSSAGESVGIDGTSVACREAVVVGVRESGSPAGTRGNFGLTGAETLSALTDQLKSRRSVSSFGLKYPARSTNAIIEEGNGYFEGVDQGVSKLVNATERVSGSCQSWIVLIGYSQGALVIRKALSGMSALARSRIAGVALFGDPARSPSDGTVRLGGEAPSRGGLYESVIDATPPVPTLGGPVVSLCNQGDAICAAEVGELLGMALQASVVGSSSTPHGQYRFDGSTQTAAAALSDQLLTLPKRPPS
jgi:Cutinase